MEVALRDSSLALASAEAVWAKDVCTGVTVSVSSIIKLCGSDLESVCVTSMAGMAHRDP